MEAIHTFYEQLCRLEIIILEKIELRGDVAEVSEVSWRREERLTVHGLFLCRK